MIPIAEVNPMLMTESLSLCSICRVRPCVLFWMCVLLCATISPAKASIEYTTGTVQSYFAVYLRFDTENLGCTEERLVENFANEENPRVSTQLQAIRLLVWTRMRQPEYRKRIFLHWLALQDSPPEESIVIEHVRRRLQSITVNELEQRITEIKEAYTQWTEARDRLLSHHLVVYTGDVDTMEDYLPDPTEPLGVKFLTLDHQKLLNFYGNLPLPYVSEKGPGSTTGIYTLLWLFEPDDELRQKYLWPRLADTYHTFGDPWTHECWVRLCQQSITELNPLQREIREKQLRELLPEIRHEISYRKWRIEQEARREREWKTKQDGQQKDFP